MDKAWFDDECRSAYQDKQEAYGLWSRNRSPLLWENFERLWDHTETVYVNAQTDYNNRIRASLADEAQPMKWLSSLKEFHLWGCFCSYSYSYGYWLGYT